MTELIRDTSVIVVSGYTIDSNLFCTIVPGVPGNFEVTLSSDGVYVATWTEPDITHGELLIYNLTYGPVEASKSTLELLPATRSYEFEDLSKFWLN